MCVCACLHVCFLIALGKVYERFLNATGRFVLNNILSLIKNNEFRVKKLTPRLNLLPNPKGGFLLYETPFSLARLKLPHKSHHY